MSKYLTKDQSVRYGELLKKWSSRKKMTPEEHEELDYLQELDELYYQDPEYLKFAAEMDAVFECCKGGEQSERK